MELGGPKLRTLLALLVTRLNRVVPADQLIEDLWKGAPPRGAGGTLQSHVSHLRRALHGAGDLLLTRPPGYMLQVEPESVDALRFERLLDAAGRNADPRRAAEALDQALALWRGRPLIQFEDEPWAQPEITRLDALRLRAVEAKVDIDLSLGRHAAVVPELEALVEANPLREHLWAQLMRALSGSGRQVDALRAFVRVRELLAETGIEPGAELIDLEAAILNRRPLPDPVGAMTLAAAPPRRPLPPALVTSGDISFVGRERERAVLRRAIEDTGRDRRRVVFVAGEPGVGKTRLSAEMAQEARAAGVTVLYGRCDEDLDVPYQPFVQALQQLADSDVGVVDELEERLGDLAGELTRLVPGLARRVRVPPRPLADDPESEKFRLFEAVAAWLGVAAAAETIVLVVDDLHWASKPTLLMLRHLIRSESVHRLCIVVAFRNTTLDSGPELTQFLAECAGVPGAERLEMTGLPIGDVEQLVVGTLSDDLGDRTAELSRTLHAATEGNPFFIAEVLRHLIESGLLRQQGHSWRVEGDRLELGIPPGVRDVVKLRIQRTSEDAVKLIACASALGAEFDLPVLARMADLGEDRVAGALDELLQARLLEAVEGPGLRHRFCHALVRAAVYDRLSAYRRALLHRDAGSAIEEVHGAGLDEHVAALAHHFVESSAVGGAERAARYCTRAGRRALARGSADEAIQHYRNALEVSDAWLAPDATRRCEQLLDIAEAQRLAGDDGQRDTFLAAARVARDIGDVDRLARAGKGFSRSFMTVAGEPDQERIAVLESGLEVFGTEHLALRARAMASLAGELLFSGDRRRSEELSAEAVELARRAGDPTTHAAVLEMHADLVWHPATLSQRKGLAAELEEVGRSSGDPMLRWRAALASGLVALETGDLHRFDRHLRAVRDLAKRLGDATTRRMTDMLGTTRAIIAGTLEEAERLLVQSSQAVASGGNLPEVRAAHAAQLFQIRFLQGRLPELEPVLSAFADLPVAHAAEALVACEAGRFDRAADILRALSPQMFAALPRDASWPFAIATCMEVSARLGEAESARTLHDLVAPYRDQFVVNRPYFLGCFGHYLGLTAQAYGDLDEAVDQLTGALTGNALSPPQLARSQRALADALCQRGGPGDRVRAEALRREGGELAERFGLAVFQS